MTNVYSFLNQRNSDRSLSSDLLGQLYSLVEQVLQRIYVVNQAHVQSVLSGVVSRVRCTAFP